MKLYIILPLCLSKYINHVFLILMPICFYMWLFVIFEKCVIQPFPPNLKNICTKSTYFFKSGQWKNVEDPLPFKSPYIHILRYTGIFENLLFQSLVIIFSFEQVWVHKCQNESYPVVCSKHNHFSIHF